MDGGYSPVPHVELQKQKFNTTTTQYVPTKVSFAEGRVPNGVELFDGNSDNDDVIKVSSLESRMYASLPLSLEDSSERIGVELFDGNSGINDDTKVGSAKSRMYAGLPVFCERNGVELFDGNSDIDNVPKVDYAENKIYAALPLSLKESERNGAELCDGNSDIDESEFVNYPNYPLIVGGIGKGSGVPGAVFNLTTSVIGAGIMALPAAMGVVGLGLGLVLIVVIGILSEISVELLVRFAVHCNAVSYGEVVEFALGRPARILCEICIIVNNAGVLVVYLIIIGDVMSGSYHHLGVFDQLMGSGVWDQRKLVILVVLLVFLAPLCALEKIDSLSLTSAASVALAVVFVVVTCSIAMVKIVEGKIDAPRMTPDLSSRKAIVNLLVVIPVMTNAYVCHFNVQPIYNELDGRSPQKMNRVVRITTLVTVMVYGFTAVSGYLLFGKKIESDVLTNFDTDLGIPHSSALNYIVRIGYILHLVLVFPVIHFSLRETVNALIFTGSSLSDSKRRLYILTSMLLILMYLGSAFIPSIWTAFKLTGATTAVSLGFIFPCLIALQLDGKGQSLNLKEKLFSWFMLIVASIVGIIGVIGNILE